MFLGIDVGTSSVKALLTDQGSLLVDQQTVVLDISRPKPLWSEQSPHWWWDAVLSAIDQIAKRQPEAVAKVLSIGLTMILL